MFMRVVFSILVAATIGFAPAHAQDRRPAIIEGKQTLPQRILVRERTQGLSAPDGQVVQSLAPLQAMFVYSRDGDWIEVGMNEMGEGLMWIPATTAVDWNQNIVATLEGGANVGQLMFFNDLDAIYDVIEAEDSSVAAGPLMEVARSAQAGGEASEVIIALGPEETIDQRSNLYVMPILNAEEAFFDSGFDVNLLKVAVARSDLGGRLNLETPSNPAPQTREDFKAAVVFVVDTTISMQPYINATREALAEVYQSIQGTDAGDSVSFGLIGFRDNLQAAPDLEYDVRTFVDLKDGFSPEAFLEGISTMTEARASSRNFREDSFAGIEYALTSMDWTSFGAKYIVLVTDASPRGATDEFASTGLSPEGLNALVRERIGGVVAALHLRTANGAQDHALAEAAYTELTRQNNAPPLYFPVENGDPEIYRETAQLLGQFIAQEVAGFKSGGGSGTIIEGSGPAASARFGVDALKSAGRTMQLAYLGATQGTAAPDVFEAYVADRDFFRPALKPLSIRVLLNKAQLSNLDEAMRLIIEQMEESIIEPDQFFNQVLVAAAEMSRNPENVGRASDMTLAQAVSISEYLDGLPYLSRVMLITEDDWLRMPISEQIDVQNELYEKLERYRRYNQATDQWVDYLGQGPEASNLLYPMRIEDLP